MKKLVITLGLLVFICIVSIALVGKQKPDFVRENTMRLLESDVEYGSFNVLEENRMVCDLATVSNIVSNMQKDGYVLGQLKNTSKYIDFIMSKDSVMYRIHYNSSGDFTSICNQYEKSYVPITYITIKDIIERKK